MRLASLFLLGCIILGVGSQTLPKNCIAFRDTFKRMVTNYFKDNIMNKIIDKIANGIAVRKNMSAIADDVFSMAMDIVAADPLGLGLLYTKAENEMKSPGAHESDTLYVGDKFKQTQKERARSKAGSTVVKAAKAAAPAFPEILVAPYNQCYKKMTTMISNNKELTQRMNQACLIANASTTYQLIDRVIKRCKCRLTCPEWNVAMNHLPKLLPVITRPSDAQCNGCPKVRGA